MNSVRDMTDAELLAEFVRVGALFDAAIAGDGHGGSPGEWAWERCGAIETEMNRRGLPVPKS